MLAIIFALISYVGWGVGDVVGMIGGRKIGALRATYWNYLLRLVFFLFISPLFVNQLRNGTLEMILLGLGLGVLTSLGSVSFYKAARLTNPSMVSAIGGSWGAISVVVSLVILRESISLDQIGAIITISAGALISIVDPTAFNMRQRINKGLAWAVLAALLWGLVGAFIKFPSRSIGWFWATMFLALPYTFVGSILQAATRSWNIHQVTRNWKVFLLASMLAGIGDSAYNIGVNKGLVSVVAPIAGSYATLSVFVASFIFQESMNMRQRIGVACTLIGIVWLSFVSV